MDKHHRPFGSAFFHAAQLQALRQIKRFDPPPSWPSGAFSPETAELLVFVEAVPHPPARRPMGARRKAAAAREFG